MNRDHGGLPARIDASVNVNPLGPPPALDEVFARTRELSSRYPEIDAASARRTWAEHLGIDTRRLLVGNGASELISLSLRAIAPRRVIVFDPCYSEYEAAARSAGVPLVHVPLALEGDSWRTPLPDGLEAGEGDLVVVGQPNNPTGHLTDPRVLLGLADSGAHVLTDESFLALAGATASSLVPHVGDRVSVVESLTKTFCVPGLRLGIFVGAEQLVERMSALRDPWSVNGIAVQAAVALADQDRYLATSRTLLATERARIAAALAALPGVRVTHGAAPFVLAELPEGRIASAVRDQLLTLGIGVRDASTFAGLSERWLRVGVRTPAENDEVLSALTGVLAEGGSEA